MEGEDFGLESFSAHLIHLLFQIFHHYFFPYFLWQWRLFSLSRTLPRYVGFVGSSSLTSFPFPLPLPYPSLLGLPRLALSVWILHEPPSSLEEGEEVQRAEGGTACRTTGSMLLLLFLLPFSCHVIADEHQQFHSDVHSPVLLRANVLPVGAAYEYALWHGKPGPQGVVEEKAERFCLSVV